MPSLSRLTFYIAAGAMLGAVSLSAAPLTLDQYLNQVKQQNKSVVALNATIDSLSKKLSEKELSTTPYVDAAYTYRADKSVTSFSQFTGFQSYAQNASVGVRWQLDNGLQLSSGYAVEYLQYPGSTLASKEILDAAPYVQATLPLMRNANGEITVATKRAIAANYEAAIQQSRFGIQASLAEAKNAYWQLSLAREIVDISEQNVERAQKLVNWATSRSRLSLTDESDVLQVQALLSLRQLELQSAKDREQSARRTFNSLRGSNVTAVERLDPVSDKEITQLAPPKITGARYDLEAAEKTAEATGEKAKADAASGNPSLNLLAQLRLNQYDQNIIRLAKQILSTDYPSYYVGFQFSTPLDSSLIQQINQGNLEAKTAAELQYAQKAFDQNVAWTELTQRLSDAQQRFQLTKRLEEIQYKKWQTEAANQRRGRATLYQVLLFEQDYANAQLSKLQTKGEIMMLTAQLSVFGR